MNKTLVWLHLSDLHLTCKPDGKEWTASNINQDGMIDSLLDAIDQLIIQKKQKPNIIFITGDLVHSGKEKEYEEAEKFCQDLLKITGLEKNQLFIVPGNHDVDRVQIEPFHIKRLYQFNTQDDISEILSEANIYSIFMRKLESFYKFYNNFFNLTCKPEQHYIIARPIEIIETSLRVNLLGLNSTLFAGYDGDDKQKLALGLYQSRKAFLALDKSADLTIAFFHHPFSCFHDCEKPIQHRIKKEADLILTGHLHNSSNIIQYDAAARVIIIAARTSYQTSESENSFNLGTLNIETGEGKVQFYKYLYEHNCWRKNVNINPYEEDGCFSFILSSREKTQHKDLENESMPQINDDDLRLLHLSDLHISNKGEATKYLSQITADLLNEIKIKRLDYLILSGDITNYATTEEYKAAASFIEELIKQFSIHPERIIITPGNHDVSYNLSRDEGYAFSYTPPDELSKDNYYQEGKIYLIRKEDGYQQRFRPFNEAFYQSITNKSYPLDYKEQAILHIDEENKLLFLALNSAWEIDHNFQKRLSIHGEALAKALKNILEGDYQNWLKIAVWHHPVTGKETMNDEFLQQLVTNGFKICMHGHIHEAEDNSFKYDSSRGIRIIAAGTFGAPAKEQVTGIPLQYNLLVWNKKEDSITVQTRKKEKPEGAWKADARWGDSNNPKAFYQIKLSKKGS